LICLMISGDKNKLWSSPLYNILHSPITSSLLGTNILSVPCSQTLSVHALPFPLHVRPNLTPIQNNWQTYGFVYFNLYVPRQQAGRQKTLNWMVASIPQN
jgi:hypothetical protein